MSESYPPQRHLLRDLDIGIEATSAEEQRAWYRPAGEGPVAVGGLLTAADLLAGSLCLRAIAPDWMATSGLTFHVAASLDRPEIELRARLLRAGRTTVTLAIDAVAPKGPSEGPSLGEGIATFARLVRRESNPSLEESEPGGRFSFSDPERPPIGRGATLRQAVGCEAVDAASGVTSTAMSPYVRNSFGAMNGGVVATLVEAAATTCAELGTVQDVAIHYLAQGRTGPVTTRAAVLRRDDLGASVRVEVCDGGEQDRVMAIAHVTVRAVI